MKRLVVLLVFLATSAMLVLAQTQAAPAAQPGHAHSRAQPAERTQNM